MKRSKKVIILACALVVVCVAAIFVSTMEKKKEDIHNSDEIVMQIPADSVTALSWRTEQEPDGFSFSRDDSGWHCDADAEFPVSEEKMQELLSVFEQFGVAFTIENAEDLSLYGLDKPLCTIEITAGDSVHEIQIGSFSAMDSQRYVSIGDGKVYLVNKDPLVLYNVSLKELIANDAPPRFATADKITFSGEENYEIVYQEDGPTYQKDDVYFASLDGELLPVNAQEINSYLATITELNLTNYVTYTADDALLAQYGLDEPELTITVDYTPEEEASESFVLQVGCVEQDEKKASDSESSSSTIAYARVADSDIIYQLDSNDYHLLSACSYDDLRRQNLIPADFEDVVQIDVNLDGNTYVIQADPANEKRDENGNRIFSYNKETTDIFNIKNRLTALQTEKFTTDFSTDTQELGLMLHLNLEGNPQVQVSLYRYDGSYCSAAVDGKPVGLVARDKVVNAAEAFHTIVLGETAPEKTA